MMLLNVSHDFLPKRRTVRAAQVMDHFFGLYVHANSFTQLKIVSARTREELITCPRRSGDSPLL